MATEKLDPFWVCYVAQNGAPIEANRVFSFQEAALGAICHVEQENRFSSVSVYVEDSDNVEGVLRRVFDVRLFSPSRTGERDFLFTPVSAGLFAKLPGGLRSTTTREALQTDLLIVNKMAGVSKKHRDAAFDYVERQQYSLVVGTRLHDEKNKKMEALKTHVRHRQPIDAPHCSMCESWWEDTSKKPRLHQHLMAAAHVAGEYGVPEGELTAVLHAMKVAATAGAWNPLSNSYAWPAEVPEREEISRVVEGVAGLRLQARYLSTSRTTSLSSPPWSMLLLSQLLERIRDFAALLELVDDLDASDATARLELQDLERVVGEQASAAAGLDALDAFDEDEDEDEDEETP